MEPLSYGVYGAGNSGLALASYLSKNGKPPLLFDRNIATKQTEDVIHSFGLIEGSYPIRGWTDNPQKFAERCNFIFVTTPSFEYRNIAKDLAPFLTKNHNLVLFSGKLFGTLEIKAVLQREQSPCDNIAEIDAIFAARKQAQHIVWVRGIKNWTLMTSSGPEKNLQERTLKSLFPGVESAVNLIQRGLTDFGAHAHSVISMLNLNKIDAGEEFRFYYDGFTEKTIKILEAFEQEIKTIALAYDAKLLPLKEILNKYYGCQTSNLYSAIRSVPNYKDSKSPNTIQHRYLIEDIACTLIPLQELAERSNIKAPILNAVISLGTCLLGNEISNRARHLDSIGLTDHSEGDIKSCLNQAQ